jgi:hypothetical protein
VLGLFGSGSTVRELPGVGKIRVPSRLDGLVKSDEEPKFSLRRYYPFYRFDAMGSETPIREELLVEILKTGAKDATWCEYRAAYKVKSLDWRTDGAFRLAEGVYTVNNLTDKVVVVTLSVPEKHSMLAYRAWRSDSSLDKARQTLTEAAKSLEV